MVKIVATKDELVTVQKLMSGTILKHRSVSKTGISSACVFVPKYFLGQKVTVILIPEDEIDIGLRKALDKKAKENGKIKEEMRLIKQQLADRETEKIESGDEPDVIVPVLEKNGSEIEGEDEY